MNNSTCFRLFAICPGFFLLARLYGLDDAFDGLRFCIVMGLFICGSRMPGVNFIRLSRRNGRWSRCSFPFFNESAVVARLVAGALNMEYPVDRIELQLLDDSTDETTAAAAALCAEAKLKGFNIVHLHRTDRSGFKAGALQEGLKIGEGYVRGGF